MLGSTGSEHGSQDRSEPECCVKTRGLLDVEVVEARPIWLNSKLTGISRGKYLTVLCPCDCVTCYAGRTATEEFNTVAASIRFRCVQVQCSTAEYTLLMQETTGSGKCRKSSIHWSDSPIDRSSSWERHLNRNPFPWFRTAQCRRVGRTLGRDSVGQVVPDNEGCTAASCTLLHVTAGGIWRQPLTARCTAVVSSKRTFAFQPHPQKNQN